MAKFVRVLCAVALLASAPLAARAHTTERVGALSLSIGWGTEPPIAGMLNRVQVIIARGGEPVTSGAERLQVEVRFGEQSKTLELGPQFRGSSGTPGDYGAPVIPTRAGRYTFRVTGTIGGVKVDKTVTSSEATFDDVVEAAEMQFPERDPSVAEVAARVEREFPRVEAKVAAVSDRTSTDRLLALLGLVVGALALVVAAVGFRRKPAA